MITASFKDENGQPVTPNGINWTLTDIWGNVITNCSSETLTTAQSVTVVLSGEDLPLQSFDDDGYQALLINCELYLKVVFKGKGGVSTGRLLAAVNRPH